jgi:CheY-like chemotaxis protein
LGRSNLKLLIVDDDPNTRTLLSEALEGRGAHVRASASAREAQDAITVWHPDLVISDVGMPRENGYDLIRHVRKLPVDAGGRTPAIACTGYARAEDRARAMSAGFDAVVAKPVDLDLLVATIVHVAGVRDPGVGDEDAAGCAVAGGRTSAPDS